MSSILTSQGVVLATAMAGTIILFAFRLQRSSSLSSSSPLLRPCLSSGERKGEKKKKRVRFAEDVVDPMGNNEIFRKQYNNKSRKNVQSKTNEMPANRLALYKGMLRDRVVHRTTYSY